MATSNYTPNFNDPRVKARCLRAIGFIRGVMSETKPRQWSTRYIDLYLGNQRNALSKWLRNQLLICVDDFYKFNSEEKSICKKYLLNKNGLDNLCEALKITQQQYYPIVVKVVTEDHSQELHSGNFQYTDKSHRLWHPLQRYRRQHKRQILEEHNYSHHYDIEAAAPTIILQYSQMIPEVIENNKWLQGPMDQYLEHIDYYLKNKQLVREELAQGLELPVDAAKEIINALFCGATISLNPHYSDIYDILQGDQARIIYLKQHEFIQNLVKDIKICWQYIRPMMQKRTRVMPNGKERLCKITCRQKWQIYFQEERRVLDAVRDYLDKSSVRYFLEHDGWSSDQAIDLCELSDFVHDKTGYRLNFDYDISDNEFDNHSED